MRILTTATKHYKTFILGGAFAVLASLPAHAIDRDGVLQLLNAQVPAETIQISDADVAIDGDDATVTNIKFNIENQPTNKLSVERIVLQDISEQGNNVYHIGKIDVPQIVMSKQNTQGDQITVEDLSATNLKVSTTPFNEKLEQDNVESLFGYETISIAHFVAADKDNEFFTFENFLAKNVIDGAIYDTTISLDHFNVPVASIPNEDGKKFYTDLGYENIAGKFYSHTNWNSANGELRLDKYDLSMDNGGTLSFNLSLDGLTAEVYSGLQEVMAQAKSGDMTRNDAAIKVMGIMQKIIFNSTELAYNEDGLVTKVLDYQAEQSGVTRQDLVNQAKFVVTMGLMQLGDQNFAENVSKQVETFMLDPQNLKVTLAPQQPSPLAMVMAYAMSSNPKALLDFLNPQVVANQ